MCSAFVETFNLSLHNSSIKVTALLEETNGSISGSVSVSIDESSSRSDSERNERGDYLFVGPDFVFLFSIFQFNEVEREIL
jgi:hypothetical protein